MYVCVCARARGRGRERERVRVRVVRAHARMFVCLKCEPGRCTDLQCDAVCNVRAHHESTTVCNREYHWV